MKPAKLSKRLGRPLSDDKLEELFYRLEAKRASREACELLFLVNPAGSALSQLAAEDLKGFKELIYRAANENQKEFFIELGKLLEGKRRKPNTWTKLDQDTAFILCFHPKIESKEAVEQLRKLGHPAMSPGSFKQKKYNWKRAATKTRQHLEKAGWQYYGNSFLDDDLP
jgi:hypothetical protein